MNKSYTFSQRVSALLIACMIPVTGLFSSAPLFSINADAVDIKMDTKESSVINKGTSGSTTISGRSIALASDGKLNYTYTGNIYTANSSVYDYLSDNEINGTARYSTASGYADPYTKLNRAISEDDDTNTVVSASDQNLTIRYKSSVRDVSNICVHLFQNSTTSNGWPGASMTYDDTTGEYVYTVAYSDIKTSGGSTFIPTKFIINGNTTGGKSWETPEFGSGLSKGSSYSYSDITSTAESTAGTVKFRVYKSALKGRTDKAAFLLSGTVRAYVFDADKKEVAAWNSETAMTSYSDYWEIEYNASQLSSLSDDMFVIFHCKQDGVDNRTPAYSISKGNFYTFNGVNSVVQDTADNICAKSCLYDIPLYFGCFYRGDTTGFYNDNNKGDGSYSGNTYSNFYNKFYWQANMSLRDDNFDATVQGLVADELVDGTIAQNKSDGSKVKLPYFNDTWADKHSNMVKYWHNIAFPFYEIDVDATKVHGDEEAGIAKYYQFNSKEMNVFLTTDDDNKTGTFTETTTQICSQKTTTDPKGTVCYFPFNSTNNATDNNLGFGTKFEINFKISSDGKVETVDSRGQPTGHYVNATFEFMGDDDVWVFIDDKLVLDLGGAHKDATGIIDFAEKKAYANDATVFGYNSNAGTTTSKDNIAGNISKQLTVNLPDVMTADTFNPDQTYNENKTHTLTMFYMERGMYESDLLVRFNFAVIANKNILKVKEITDFENAGINAGLLDLTKKAADGDVFNYTMSNTGTDADSVGKSGILTPTYDYYQRQNQGLKALLTGQQLETTNEVDSTGIYIDANWQDKGASCYDNYDGSNSRPKTLVGVWAWKTGQSGVLIMGEKVSTTDTLNNPTGNDHLYKFDTLQNYDNIQILRLNADTIDADYYYTGQSSLTWGTPHVWNNSGNITLSTLGVTYRITGKDNSYAVDNTTRYNSVIKYYENNFDPDSEDKAKNTNYIWKDDFAVMLTSQGDDIDGMTGTTDSTGSFRLMYGTADKESSAEFQHQFKRDSTMTVVQNDNLRKADRTNHATTKETFSNNNGRTVSEYYNTTVKVEDTAKNIVYSDTNTNTAKSTTYNYDNADSVSQKEPVNLTETFTNTPKVGVLTVTKTLNPNDNVDDDFNFQLTIEEVFGVSGINVADYSAINANHKITNSDGKGKFSLKVGETMIITGIPYGTKYKVVELSSTDASGKTNYEQVSNTNTGFETVDEGSLTGQDLNRSTVADNNETVVNTRLTNSLTLQKLLGKSAGYTYTDDDKNKEFTFQVTLTAPTGVKLGDYRNGITGITIGADVESTYTFTKQVSYNNSVTISGLPYGTTYNVQEINLSNESNWDKTGESGTSGTGAEIGETASTATITNTYTPPPKGDLSVTKTLLNEIGEHNLLTEDAALPFSFKVTLTDSDEADLTGSVTYETTLSSNGVDTDGTLTFTNGVATFSLSDGQTLTVKEILAGYHFEVEETPVPQDFELKNSSGTIGIIKADATSAAAFTNQKSKTVEPYVLPDAGVEDMRMTYMLILFGMLSCGIAYWYVNREKVRKP